MQQKIMLKREIDYKPVSQLLLDSRNPRLPEEAINSSQIELIKLMEHEFNLLPIGQSMSDNGYFVEEPLIVIPKADEDKFIVVEGNRRLAALKLLSEPELRKHSSYRETWQRLGDASKYDLTQVPVIIHQNREDLIAILGFRHISGIMKWDPLSKARYIHNLVERRGPKANFGEMARQLGSRSNTVRDNYATYRIYIQARDQFEIDTSELEENFSVFYRALSNTNIQKFVGFTKKHESPAKLRSPISEKRHEALKELIEFVHGTSDRSSVITDSRQLTMLGKVLASPEALQHLRHSRNLKDAYAFTGGEERSLIESLNAAGFHLSEALRYAHRYRSNVEVARVVERCAESFFEILKHFPKVETKFEHKRDVNPR